MELLLGALAEAIIAILLEDLTQRPRLAALRDKLRGDSPEKLAVNQARQALAKRDVIIEEGGEWRLLMPLFQRWLHLQELQNG